MSEYTPGIVSTGGRPAGVVYTNPVGGRSPESTSRIVRPQVVSAPQAPAYLDEVTVQPEEFAIMPISDMQELAVPQASGGYTTPGIVAAIHAMRIIRPLGARPGHTELSPSEPLIIADARRVPNQTLMNTFAKNPKLAGLTMAETRAVMNTNAPILVGGRLLLEHDGEGDDVLWSNPLDDGQDVWGVSLDRRSNMLKVHPLDSTGSEYIRDCKESLVTNIGWLAVRARKAGNEVHSILKVYGGGAIPKLRDDTVGDLMISSVPDVEAVPISDATKSGLTQLASVLIAGALGGRDALDRPQRPMPAADGPTAITYPNRLVTPQGAAFRFSVD